MILFHVKFVQQLTDSHKQQIIQFCYLLMEQPDPEISVRNVISTDKKYFRHNQKPHNGIWSREIPHEILETIIVMMKRLRFLFPLSMAKLQLCIPLLMKMAPATVLLPCYLDLLNEVACSTFRYQQLVKGTGGCRTAPRLAHCTTEAKGFLVDKFRKE